MAERCIKGDYIGFTFGGVHSSELGLMRVSDGSRYNQDLLPPLQDKTAQVNGRDGAVYFGSQYNTRPIKVPVAFDNMTEDSFKQLKKLLQDKKPKYLWFDETPYKQWLVKAANAQSFKWVCFDESHNGKEKRIYKGEGTLEFSCFSPYAESRVTFLDTPIDSVIFKANGKLSLGTTPYLEILTIENGKVDRQLFSSQTIGDRIKGNKKFLIKEADNLLIEKVPSETGYDAFSISCKEYVKRMTNKGYLTLAESDLSETTDVEGNSPRYGFWGLDTKGNYHYATRVGIISKTELEKLRSYIKTPDSSFQMNSSGFQITKETIKIRSYGSIYKKNVKVKFFRKATDANDTYRDRYGECDFVVDNRDQPYILLYEDSLGHQKVLKPVYDMDNNLSGVEEANVNIKILSLKDGIKNGENQVIPANNTLINSYNYYEWVQSSGLRKQYDFEGNPLYNTYTSNRLMPVYNAGDIPTDCQIIISKTNLERYTVSNTSPIKFSISSSFDPNTEVGQLILKSFSLLNGDEGIILDSKLKLIKGYRLRQDGSIELTGTVYNKHKKEGDFFKIPVCADEEYYEVRSYANIPFEIQYKHHYI